jgi:hypothetical protein
MTGKLFLGKKEITKSIEIEGIESVDGLYLQFDKRFHFHKATSGLEIEEFQIELEDQNYTILGKLDISTNKVSYIKGLPKKI